MAAVAMPSRPAARDDGVMDTRTPSPIHRQNSNSSSATTESYKPDLSAEVTMLSTKLVNALNYQTNLDDSLQVCRHELEQSRLEASRLRAQTQEWEELMESGTLVRKANMEKQIVQLKAELAGERAARELAEKSKKQTEGELENLTTALFEEANTMVAAARKDSEALERRNSQLRSQLDDTELLLASQQEQLRDLKDTMEKMERASDRDTTGQSSVPTTPIHSMGGTFENMLSPSSVGAANIAPEHPLHFSQLLFPVLRHDVAAYNEFQDLLQLARRGMPHSRNNSNNANNANSMASSSQTNLTSMANSSPNLPGAFSFSGSSSPQSSSFFNTPPLKDSKFYKRTLVEDLEPTLRLDLAPGLSFLSRRTVLSSLLLGTLVVEPFLPQTKFYGPLYACSLCGESRKIEPYIRKHRFRTSEEDNAQRYPLCDYCLTRIRVGGDFVGFLRMVRDGHWRAETEEEQHSAWEESVRLRERMFWARLGGGVVPAVVMGRRGDVPDSPSTTAGVKSQRPSFEGTPLVQAKSPSKLAMVENVGREEADEEEDDDGAVVDVFQQTPAKAERPFSVATAIVGASEAIEDQPPPRTTTLDTADSQTTDATTPFEDAQTEQRRELETPEPIDSAVEKPKDHDEHFHHVDGANEQLRRETEEAEAVVNPIPEPEAVPEKEMASRLQSPEEHRSTDNLAAPPAEAKRASGVLARVRAMEAKAQHEVEKKLPGAFE